VEHDGPVLPHAARACGHLPFRQALAGIVFRALPTRVLLYGVNDIVDAETDSLNPRKGSFMFGSRGAREQLAALKWQIVVVQMPFVMAFYFFVGPRILWWYALLLLAVGLYNAPGVGWKGRPPFDVLIQASYLLVFVLSSWLNKVPQLPWQTFLFGALFAMHSHIFGEVMDIEPDRLSRRRTTATSIGRVSAKFLIAAFLCVETGLGADLFSGLDRHGLPRLRCSLVLARCDSTVEEPGLSSERNAPLLVGWNAAALLGMLWNWTHSTLTHVRFPPQGLRT